MEELEGKILNDLTDIELFKQLADKLHEESATKRMKTTESICKVLDEYYKAGVLKLQNSVTEFLLKIYTQAAECAIQGINSNDEKFQAAWSLILLKLIKIQLEDEEIHENAYFIRCISHLFSNRSFKVLSYLMREYQDIAISTIKTLTMLVQQRTSPIECMISMFKCFPTPDKVKPVQFVQKLFEDLPKKRKRIENFDPEIGKQKILIETNT